jgi:hypothetical protein
MPNLDEDLLWVFAYRVIEVVIVWAIFVVGTGIRWEMRHAGWSTTMVRVTTALTWLAVVAAAGRLLLPATRLPALIALDTIVFNIGLVFFVIAMTSKDWIRAAIAARPSGPTTLVNEVERIFRELNVAGTSVDRAEVDADLAALDRWLTPATFEYIQLARSRVVSGLDGGPRAGDREERWSRRMWEVREGLAPSWRADRLSSAGQMVRRPILAAAPWLAAFCGGVLGRSVLAGPVVAVVPTIVLLGYLAAWAWDRVILPVWLGLGVGLAVTAFMVDAGNYEPTSVTVVVLEVVIVLVAVISRRSDRRQGPPSFTVVPPGSDDDGNSRTGKDLPPMAS